MFFIKILLIFYKKNLLKKKFCYKQKIPINRMLITESSEVSFETDKLVYNHLNIKSENIIDSINIFFQKFKENEILNTLMSIPYSTKQFNNFVAEIRFSFEELCYLLSNILKNENIEIVYLKIFNSIKFYELKNDISDNNKFEVKLIISSHIGIYEHSDFVAILNHKNLSIITENGNVSDKLYEKLALSIFNDKNHEDIKLRGFFNKIKTSRLNNINIAIFICDTKVFLLKISLL